ncbi:MAG: hypothetical protein C0417_03525 [Chlorobiaceae bacterium]|nr:hypothetical protein [Chlorobiaceae bacterium]
MRHISICCFLFIGYCFSNSQSENSHSFFPKYEVRAVWLTTVNSLDWPPSLNAEEQRQSLKEMVRKLKEANFNTIYFQVRSRADAMYKSSFEPWAQQLTGVLGKDPGWDPLQFIIEEAHANRIEVHPWVNTYIAWTKKEPPSRTKPLHVFFEHPEWLQQVNGESWFDPGNPAARDYILRVALEIVDKYDIDGIQFDFIRYPGKPLPDNETFKIYGNGSRRDDWRRENINNFVKAFHDSAMNRKPMLKIGAAPIGIYKNFNGAKGQQSYSELYQDSRKWLSEGWMDYLVPQVYWSSGTTAGDPDFNIIVKEWAANLSNRQIIVGVGAFKQDVFEEIPSLIDTTRQSGLFGNSFFRYDNIKEALLMGNRYKYPAQIPPMEWKDSIPPLRPTNVLVSNITDGIFQINWDRGGIAHDGDNAIVYNIYRSPDQPIDNNNPINIIGTVSSGVTNFLDTIKHISSSKYYYGVTSLDKGDNESSLSVESVIIPEIVELSAKLQFQKYLKIIRAEAESSELFFMYEISDSLPVIVKLIDQYNKEIVTVVDKYQTAGRYIAGADLSELREGEYTCLFLAGSSITKKKFFLKD